jgi:hypothetical protein
MADSAPGRRTRKRPRRSFAEAAVLGDAKGPGVPRAAVAPSSGLSPPFPAHHPLGGCGRTGKPLQV